MKAGSVKYAEMQEKIHGRNLVVTFPKRLQVALQFVKIANYFGDYLCEEWGGDYITHQNAKRVQEGKDKFLIWGKWSDNWIGQEESHRWVHRIDPQGQWSPSNCEFRDYPCSDLGLPFEPYFGYGGNVLTIEVASRLLSIEPKEFVKLKLSLVLDILVLDESIRRMLRPRTLWPKITVDSGLMKEPLDMRLAGAKS